MKLDQAADDGEPDPETALGSIRRLVALHEQVEHRREPIGTDPTAVVANADHHLRALAPAFHLDMATRVRVFRRVLQQVRNHLRKTHHIALDEERADRHRDGEVMLPRVDQWPGDFDGARHRRGDVETLAPQIDLAHRRT